MDGCLLLVWAIRVTVSMLKAQAFQTAADTAEFQSQSSPEGLNFVTSKVIAAKMLHCHVVDRQLSNGSAFL